MEEVQGIKAEIRAEFKGEGMREFGNVVDDINRRIRDLTGSLKGLENLPGVYSQMREEAQAKGVPTIFTPEAEAQAKRRFSEKIRQQFSAIEQELTQYPQVGIPAASFQALEGAMVSKFGGRGGRGALQELEQERKGLLEQEFAMSSQFARLPAEERARDFDRYVNDLERVRQRHKEVNEKIAEGSRLREFSETGKVGIPAASFQALERAVGGMGGGGGAVGGEQVDLAVSRMAMLAKYGDPRIGRPRITELERERSGLMERMVDVSKQYFGLPENERVELMDRYVSDLGRIEKEYGRVNIKISEGSKLLREFSDAGRTTLPAYTTTAINAALQVIGTGMQMYRAEQTMFDLGSPQGMANALYQRKIFETQTLARSGGQALGMGIGLWGGLGMAAAMGLTGGAALPLALGAMFVGSTIGGDFGGQLGTFLTTGTEREQKLFNTVFGQATSTAGQFNQFQRLQFMLRRYGITMGEGGDETLNRLGFDPMQQAQMGLQFTGIRGGIPNAAALREYALGQRATQIDLPTLLSLGSMQRFIGRDIGVGDVERIAARTGTPVGRPELVPALLSLFQQATTRFTGGEMIGQQGMFLAGLPAMMLGEGAGEFGRIGQGGLQTLGALQGMMEPRNEAQRAFLFRAYMSANPDMSFMDINLKMREGLTAENLAAVLKILPRGNVDLAKAYLMALMPENTNPDIIRRIANQWAGGKISPDKIAQGALDVEGLGTSLDLEGRAAENVLPEDVAKTRMMLKNLKIGAAFQQEILDLQMEWNDMLNDFSRTTQALRMMKDMIKRTAIEADKFLEPEEAVRARRQSYVPTEGSRLIR